MSFRPRFSLKNVAMAKLSTEEELDLLERARGGDERAYEVLIERHRHELHAHCYRMLASVHDADDAVQDTLLRAWQGLANFQSRSENEPSLYENFELLVSKPGA
jgi:RNA polymerase sigma-70 factor, ECF subfamily